MLEYTTNELMPGKLFFRCERMRATLTVDACAGMWRKADETRGSDCGTCMLCPQGAVHAGETAASMSPLKGTLTCARCHRVGARLIGGHRCVSCYNREREVVVGRNAKGTAPVKHCGLSARRIRYQHGDEVCTLAMPRTADVDELMVAVLRDSSKRVVFGWNSSPPASLRQKRLW